MAYCIPLKLLRQYFSLILELHIHIIRFNLTFNTYRVVRIEVDCSMTRFVLLHLVESGYLK
jgi:hypothetical protein